MARVKLFEVGGEVGGTQTVEGRVTNQPEQNCRHTWNQRSETKNWNILRWFEEVAPLKGAFEQATEMVATEIKPPMGSIYQKYVYTCFIVKMRIHFGSFGFFWFNLGWG